MNHVFIWPLDATTIAEVRILGPESVTREHLEALIEYLTIARRLLGAGKHEKAGA